MSNNKLKIGVIGCGMVANIGHLPIYHKSPLTELVAVADPNETHLKKVAKSYNIPSLSCQKTRGFSRKCPGSEALR